MDVPIEFDCLGEKRGVVTSSFVSDIDFRTNTVASFSSIVD